MKLFMKFMLGYSNLGDTINDSRGASKSSMISRSTMTNTMEKFDEINKFVISIILLYFYAHTYLYFVINFNRD